VDVVYARDRATAVDLLEHRDDVVGVITEIALGEADPMGGLAVLGAARRVAPGIVRIAFTFREDDAELRRAVREVGAVCVPKEEYRSQLDPFLEQMLQWAAARPWRTSAEEVRELSSVPPPALDEAVEALRVAVFADATKRDLTEDQAAALYAMVRGLGRREAAEALSCSVSAYDKRLAIVRARYAMTNGDLRRTFMLRVGARRGT